MSLTHPGDAELEAMRARVYRWAFRLLRNHEDALDATQNVLLRALAPAGAGVAGAAQPFAWLRRVTVNHCIDLLRARRPVRSADAVPETAAPGVTAEAVERSRRITEALASLTPPQRAVLVAKAYDGETFEEIGRALGIGASTAKTHYVRALRRMRERLGPAERNLP